jgi:polyisoprenoid-binding protein YceI
MPADDQSSSRPRNKAAIAAVVVAAFVAIGGAGLFWYLNQPVPEEVSLESAVADVENAADVTSSQPPAPDSTETTEAPGAPEGLDGVWTVDTSVGDFSFEEATSSFLGFRIAEVLASVGSTTAVGRTPEVVGTLTVAGTSITDTVIEADLSQIVTNASRRDRAARRAMGTDEFPIASFTLSVPIDIGAIPAEGEPVLVTAVGDLEIKGVTQPIEIPLEAQLVGDLIVVVGAVDITFADWGVELPTAPGVVSIEDHGILELQLFFRRG